MRRTRNLTRAALMAALAVVFLYLTGILPTGGLGFAALASICTSVVYLECGVLFAVGHYIVTGLLSLLLVPEKTYVLWFLLAFGHYAILKLLIEKLPKKPLQWVLKVLVFAASMAAVLGLMRLTLGVSVQGPVLWVLLLAVFIVYDIGVSGVLTVYRRRVHR